MSVELTYAATVNAVETLEDNVPAATAPNRKVRHDQYNGAASLSGSTTPPVTRVAAFEKALSAGAATIDLTSLLGTNGATVDGTGLKVQVLKIKNKTANANPITVKVGLTDGYQLAGANFEAQISPGQEFLFYGNDATPDIGATARTLDLAGTGSQAAEVIIVMG
jgi:hypothetical protein